MPLNADKSHLQPPESSEREQGLGARNATEEGEGDATKEVAGNQEKVLARKTCKNTQKKR